MKDTDRSALAVAIAMVLASFVLHPLTQDSSYLGLSWVLIVLLGVVSVVLRRLHANSAVVFGAQLGVWAVATLVIAAQLPAVRSETGLFDHVGALFGSAVGHMQTQSAPMTPNDGVKLLFVSCLALIAVLTDLLVLGLRRPALGLAPTATVFLIPALGLGQDTGIGPFLLIGFGYLAILIAEGLNANARWTRGLSRDSADEHGTADPVVWRAAAYIGLPALVLVTVLGMLLPTISLGGFGFGNGPGNGGGPIQLADPTLDLKRNLTEPRNRPVLEYRTDNNDPLYLRLASLPAFSRAGWTNAQTPLQQGPDFPAVPGMADTDTRQRSTRITVTDFASEYLPMPYAPRSVDVQGSWGIDPNSLVMVSSNRNPRARADASNGLTYTVQSVDIDPTAADLAASGVGTPVDSETTLAVPSDLPPRITELAKRITASGDTASAKAALLQAYFRSTKNFTYSTAPQPGSGYQALTNFLFEDKKGYCEQFAASMALMARIVGIPSRVAVGFLPGERDGDHWTVSVKDMHAWPELYFSGYGWVRYEPTPSSVTGTAPAWSVRGTTPSQSESDSEPSTRATTRSQPSAPASNRANEQQTAPVTQAPTHPLRNVLIGLAVLVGLAVLAAPASIRIRRRGHRFDRDREPSEQVEGAWSEVRDTVIDYGGSWPSGSPRTIGAQVGDRLEPSESEAMGRLAVLVERSRYAQTFDDDLDRELAAMTSEIRRGLAEPQPWHRRLAALLVPRSVFRGLLRFRRRT